MFSKWMEKSKITQVHKKGDEKSIENYLPVSLLPICSKTFEKSSLILSLNI